MIFEHQLSMMLESLSGDKHPSASEYGVGILVVAEYIESRACYSVVNAEAESRPSERRSAPKSPSRVNRVLRQFGGQRFRD